MAPNPSAALRVLLAWLIAAGPAPVYAAQQGPTPPAAPSWAGKTEGWPAWYLFSVPGVGDVYCHYTDCGGAWLARQHAQNSWLQNGISWARRKLHMDPQPVIGRAVQTPGTAVPVYREKGQTQSGAAVTAEFYAADVTLTWDGSQFTAHTKDGKTAAAEPRDMLSNTNGTLVVRLVAAPPPETKPVPGQHPQPGHHPSGPGGHGPATQPAVVDIPWRSVPLNEGKPHAAHVKCKKDECTCASGACKGKRIALYRLTSAKLTAGGLTITAEAAQDYFLNFKAGKYNICRAANVKTGPPQGPVRSFDETGFTADDTYSLKGAEDKPRKLAGLKSLKVDFTGTVPAQQDGTVVDDACVPEAADASKDPLDAKLDELFTNKVERMGAAWLATNWDGKTGKEAHDALLAALSGQDKDKTVTAARAKIQSEVATQVDKGASGLSAFMPKFSVSDQDLLDYLCPLLPKQSGTAAQPSSGATSAMAQVHVAADKGATAAHSGDVTTAKAGSDITTRTTDTTAGGQPPALPFPITDAIRNKCASHDANQAEPPPATLPTATVPPPGPGQQVGPITSDKDKDAKDKAKADAKKKDLQRMAIGGMGGALVLGVFGFIFGGPIGAIAMGAIGFGVMAGVTYLNNHPIG